METSAVGVALGAPPVQRDRGIGSLKSEDFFHILVTELQQQDPLQPSDTGDLVNQVSQIRGIELSSQLTKTLDELSRQQRVTGSSDMIGKFVTAVAADAGGNPTFIDGVVTGVRFDTDGAAVLELDSGQAVRADDVVRVSNDSQPGSPTLDSSALLGGSDAKDSAAARRMANPKPPFSLKGLFHL